jgi:hypothetical protein
LQPGTYALKEVGAEWCHAESDSVDSRGNVIVRAGARANVWIFDCLGTRNPPNSGAGPLAGLGGGASGLGLVLGWLWPALGAGVVTARRRWAWDPTRPTRTRCRFSSAREDRAGLRQPARTD